MKLILEATPEEISALVAGLWEPLEPQEIIRELAKRGYIIAKDETRLKN